MQLRSLADIARLVRTQRHKLGLSQQDAANRVGVSRQLIGRLERGLGGTSVETFLKVASALDIELEGHTQQTTPGLQPEMSGFLDAFDRLLVNEPRSSEASND